MTILFSTTAGEAVVINFELRLGSLERLLLAPISLPSVLLGKVLGRTIFGLLMTTVVTIVQCLFLDSMVRLMNTLRKEILNITSFNQDVQG